MFLVAGGVYGVFGVLSIAGGAIGFKRANSRASLIAGGLAGAALLGAAFLVGTGASSAGLALGGGVSTLLAVRFVPAYLRTKKLMPQGLMAGLSILSAAVTAAALLG
jgi:uncharacterized membrane protein (UPF0136 family)